MKARIQKEKKNITCHMSPVTYHLSPIKSHSSQTPTVTATDPPYAISPTMHNMLIHQDRTPPPFFKALKFSKSKKKNHSFKNFQSAPQPEASSSPGSGC